MTWMPSCEKEYFELSEEKKNFLSFQLYSTYKEENEFALKLIKYIQNYILDKTTVTTEEKVLFIPPLKTKIETTIETKKNEEIKRTISNLVNNESTLSQSGATGTESASEGLLAEQKKKKKKKKKAKSVFKISPIFDSTLSTYIQDDAKKNAIKAKLGNEKELYELILLMDLKNKELAKKNTELEMQVNKSRYKVAGIQFFNIRN